MPEIKTWDEISEDFKEMVLRPLSPKNIRKYSKNHVFDENQSVKWNKEEAENRNALYDAEVQRLSQEKANFHSAILEDVYRRIQFDIGYGVSREKAIAIWSYAYDEASCKSIDEDDDINSFAVLVVQELIGLIKSVLDNVHRGGGNNA